VVFQTYERQSAIMMEGNALDVRRYDGAVSCSKAGQTPERNPIYCDDIKNPYPTEVALLHRPIVDDMLAGRQITW
jgi:hypothetical protein